MVCIVADFQLFVNETVVDVLSSDELRQGTALLFEDRPKSIRLRLFFPVDQHFIAAFYP